MEHLSEVQMFDAICGSMIKSRPPEHQPPGKGPGLPYDLWPGHFSGYWRAVCLGLPIIKTHQSFLSSSKCVVSWRHHQSWTLYVETKLRTRPHSEGVFQSNNTVAPPAFRTCHHWRSQQRTNEPNRRLAACLTVACGLAARPVCPALEDGTKNRARLWRATSSVSAGRHRAAGRGRTRLHFLCHTGHFKFTETFSRTAVCLFVDLFVCFSLWCLKLLINYLIRYQVSQVKLTTC